RLVSLVQALWKIPLTFLALIAGGSVGREGPSVQVGAALMLAWGKCCRLLGVPLVHVQTSELIATGAAGGLAAAFNAPLAGVIF
ncbi:MAG TPA: chloride channel protein EriC, partial [Pusillimonas sp.]|nr:chloride channel protein EriC [Pusillimonas sp.]